MGSDAAVEWTVPPEGGAWLRHFRLGEWLGEPVTPLFESWLLPRLERQLHDHTRREFGLVYPEPQHVVVNGWYFSSASLPAISPVRLLLRRPSALLAMGPPAAQFIQVAERRVVVPFLRDWRSRILPHYRRVVEEAEATVDGSAPGDLVRLVDRVADVAGEALFSLTIVGGAAWKAEVPLAAFYRRHLARRIGGSHQRLLAGLAPAAHDGPAVASLDWFRAPVDAPAADGRPEQPAADRAAAEAACRAALADHPWLVMRFDRLLGVAQRCAPLREEQAAAFTLGWPVMRRAVLRLGAGAQRRGAIDGADDVFFLTRDELDAGRRDLRAQVGGRRAAWECQRLLTPPLVLGHPGGLIGQVLADVEKTRSATPPAAPAVTGLPASPGRATGPVRVIRGADEFDRLCAGEVLVAPVTTPAWTLLFGLAAAVVTDTGSIAAHASLVAREYGIPAVVATGDATARLRDGQLVTVDGSAGYVEPA